MSQKETFWFDSFHTCAACALSAVQTLDAAFRQYSPSTVSAALQTIRGRATAAQKTADEGTDALLRAFITPVEPVDIGRLLRRLVAVSAAVVGATEEYCARKAPSIGVGELKQSDQAVELCRRLRDAVDALPGFRKSKEPLSPVRAVYVAATAWEKPVAPLGPIRQAIVAAAESIEDLVLNNN